jgi:hypothetical protein
MKRLLQRANAKKCAGKPGWLIALSLCASTALLVASLRGFSATPQISMGQSSEEADRKSAGCITCHSPMDEPTMHPTKTVPLGCTDCHGGNSSAGITQAPRRIHLNISPQKKGPTYSRAIPVSAIVAPCRREFSRNGLGNRPST